MNRKTLFAALACALLVFSMLGCGASSHLRSIQVLPSSATSGGTFDVFGIGGTLQLVATGTYSGGTTKDLTHQVTWQISVTPGSADDNGFPLPTPPDGLQLGTTGLLTAQSPGVCTWVNVATGTTTSPAWALSGSYTVTATEYGITSPPVYIAVASAVGIPSTSNPSAECGPQPTTTQ